MKTPDPAWVKFLQEQYPSGSRVRLREMGSDAADTIAPGCLGTLDHIDDAGVFHVKWDNGPLLSMIIGVDRFSVLPPEPTLLKLYMPLTADIYERNEYGDLEYEGRALSGKELLSHEGAICKALVNNRMPEERERGIMHRYDHDDSINDKVRSVVFTAEEKEGQLWGIAECRVAGTLTTEEMVGLTEYISGQASDGWGESFEQREIQTADGGELYVHLWNGDNWSIMPEQDRFDPEFSKKPPDLCWSVLPSEGSLIYIKRGEGGYHLAKEQTVNPEINRYLADHYNQKHGISKAQENAMVIGSMFGWDKPLADPSAYEALEEQSEGGMTLA